MRGSHVLACMCPSGGGIIPAHAGLTMHHRVYATSTRDHPRACGAHTAKWRFAEGKRGSSPRMRGSLRFRNIIPAFQGIIPAHAGLTRSLYHRQKTYRDHPRACGAHAYSSTSPDSCGGSSPRMRGSPSRAVLLVRCLGIIPAHAGLTRKVTDPDGKVRDHPRACGAHGASLYFEPEHGGSSPRMRGSHGSQRSISELPGIIPAHAGLTGRTMQSWQSGRDHPRACGAHRCKEILLLPVKGSSPRMRGSLLRRSRF